MSGKESGSESKSSSSSSSYTPYTVTSQGSNSQVRFSINLITSTKIVCRETATIRAVSRVEMPIITATLVGSSPQV